MSTNEDWLNKHIHIAKYYEDTKKENMDFCFLAWICPQYIQI